MSQTTVAETTRTVRRRLIRALRGVRRTVLARRRIGAALLAGVAVAAGLRALAVPTPTTAIQVVRHDLEAGAVVRVDDLVTVEVPPESVPAGIAKDAAGRTLAAPLRRGEPVTDVRLLGPAFTQGYPGLTAVPVRLPDAAAVALLQPGDRIDLVSSRQRGGSGLLTGATVLAIPEVPSDTSTGGAAPAGRLVVLGVPVESAYDTSRASVQDLLSFTFSG
jgi:Flp pilus assembly protein CpaB